MLLEFQELGKLKTGMFNIAVSHCCKTWLKAVDDYSTNLQASLIYFSSFIKDALLFGPVYKRNLRFYLEILTADFQNMVTVLGSHMMLTALLRHLVVNVLQTACI